MIALALEGNPQHTGMLYRQALILKKKGDVKQAIVSAEKSLAGAKQANPELKAEYTRLNKALLDELKKSRRISDKRPKAYPKAGLIIANYNF